MAKNSDPTEKLYFVALVPPEPLRTQLLDLKLYFKEKYNSSKSLNSPPHITLHMPFSWKEAKENILIETLTEVGEENEPFDVGLSGFSAFEPRVIFVQPIENEALRELQKKVVRTMRLALNLFNADYKDRGFHPHITLAFRDLKKQQFVLAWEEFQNKQFEARFVAKNICLLKHNGQFWEIFKELPLAKHQSYAM